MKYNMWVGYNVIHLFQITISISNARNQYSDYTNIL